jgi:choline dehydrogenase-like flavoprotein
MYSWKSVNYDAIVIGSGPGGASIAAELSRQGKKVLILERGKGTSIKGTMLQSVEIALIPGRGLYFTSELLAMVRGIVLGGSSILSYATAFEPNYEIFEKQGIELRPDIEQVKKGLPIAPLSDNLLGPSAKRIQTSARALGYPWEKLPKMVHQDKCRTNCDKCTMGCPYGAKWTARELVNQALAYGSTVLTGANVVGMHVSDSHISGVQFTMGGRKHEAKAPIVILAAGGIGTPLVLRRLGIAQAGTNFFFDPLVVVAGTIDDLDNGREFPMSAGFHDPEAGYLLSDLTWPDWIRQIFTLRVGRVDKLAGHRKMASVMVKITDELGGRLTRFGWPDKTLTDGDRDRLKNGIEIARKIVRNAGARNLYITGTTAVHPGGTAKIGEVVDSNLKTKFDNLYVCDCSVIPASWGLPPTLTILALAKRLAKHLSNSG